MTLSLNHSLKLAAIVAATSFVSAAHGAKLVEVRPVDDRHVMLHFEDGDVLRSDDGKGEDAFKGHESHGVDTVVRHDPPLDVDAAQNVTNYSIVFEADGGMGAMQPVNAFRKTKVNGVPGQWPEPEYTLEHTIFLELPERLEPGHTYTVSFENMNSDKQSATFTYEPTASVSEAIKVNLIGYDPTQTVMKSADLYMFLGDGGPRDYADYEGNTVSLYNVETEELIEVGAVAFHADRGQEYGNWDLTGSPVWTCDFSDFEGEGTFRLVVDGVGASRDFVIEPNVYEEPFATSVLGFYYMRIGEPMTDAKTAVMGDDMPPPRQPRFIPEGNDAGIPADPPGFKVIRTTMSPNHPDWNSLGGDPWDNKDWSAYVEEGSPDNPNAYGGHSDALDWDRRFQHINIVFELLLPYTMMPEQLGNDDLNIAESGNGIPDLLDSAANEADYWRRLRDGDGNFSFGINNPVKEHTHAYQAAAAPWMAHANAAMCAMLADAYRLAGQSELADDYLATALDAYERGGDGDLDTMHHVGNSGMRGRDLRAMAAGYLYKLTGEKKYEDAYVELLEIDETGSLIGKPDFMKSWAALAYLSAADEGEREIGHPDVLEAVKQVIVDDAENKHLKPNANFPSRRSSYSDYGWFQTVIEVSPLMLAHRYGDIDEAKQNEILAALLAEADYSLGRNPLNLILMTGAEEPYIVEAYTSGRNDGFPGVHPGHTPYMNQKEWGESWMANPGWMSDKGYPAWEEHWPHGEALWDNWFCFCNNEFTPQQTMGGKTALYAYLHAALKQ
ncbi:MAG: glycoside hydrolase family 9 protein [Planctomycetota bacterium]